MVNRVGFPDLVCNDMTLRLVEDPNHEPAWVMVKCEDGKLTCTNLEDLKDQRLVH